MKRRGRGPVEGDMGRAGQKVAGYDRDGPGGEGRRAEGSRTTEDWERNGSENGRKGAGGGGMVVDLNGSGVIDFLRLSCVRFLNHEIVFLFYYV